ncbi:hypothetical protein HWV62_6551 [Athelia sp. TMB]|nr:hypothetical protein HWV62_6551 [Athelia sp. TMB]
MSAERSVPGPSVSKPTAPQHLDYMADPMLAPSCPASFTDLATLPSKKGKEREGTLRFVISRPRVNLPSSVRAPKAWWLDISSPTWEDMRAIGKLLHLHPLTLEDILQQDPREKLELFPRLGYYFVSFRAIESRATRERFRRLRAIDTDRNDYLDDGGAVGEVNIYLVVFREGVVSFHFEDIADWIAHGILDSVVDSFFPFLEEVEKEVLEVEDIVFSEDPRTTQVSELQPTMSSVVEQQSLSEKASTIKQPAESEKLPVAMDEKLVPQNSAKTRFSFPRPTPSLILRRLKRAVQSISISISLTITVTTQRAPSNSTNTTLRRMARTRRLVTSLTRLLATKSEVVAQIRKRLLMAGHSGLGNGAGKDDDIEVAIYMGDVQGMTTLHTSSISLIKRNRSYFDSATCTCSLRAYVEPVTS